MTNTPNLTDREFWLNYWKGFQAAPVSENQFFEDLLDRLPQGKKRLLEVGGFPGSFCAYFKKKLGYDVTLVDFIAFPEPIRSVEKANQLGSGEIGSIEGDFFALQPERKFDVVFSAGFIEHFDDTRRVIARHLEWLADDGTLFITLPNFRGLNGFVQKTLDPKNFKAHNLQSMDLARLRETCASLGLHEVSVFYHGMPCLWLDHPEQIHPLIRKLVYLTSYAISKLPGKGRFLAPHIVVLAKK